MKENIRLKLIEEQKEYNDAIIKKQQILDDIKDLVEELKKIEIVNNLKELGTEYKLMEQEQERRKKIKDLEMDKLKDYCVHPLLCKMSYKKHNASNRVISTSRENAEYCSAKCLECGKLVYTKNNDNTEDWDSYIHVPYPLIGIEKNEFVKRTVLSLPEGVKFNDIYNYYQEIMLDNEEEITIKKVLEKIKQI